MKKQKFTLGTLKVQSFVTSLEKEDNQTVKAGGGPNVSNGSGCENTNGHYCTAYVFCGTAIATIDGLNCTVFPACLGNTHKC